MNRKIQNVGIAVFLATSLTGCAWLKCLAADCPAPPPEENCSAACANMEKLGCPEGKPLPDGTTCEKFCEDTITAGHAMNSACVATATTCERVHSVCMM